ncbi:MAG: ABC transporter permease, partial [Gemmatimonadales bacterium]
SSAGNCDAVFSYPMFRDLERQQQVLTGLAAHRNFGAALSYQNRSIGGDGLLVSGSYFDVLGLTPAKGRLLSPADDQTIGGHFVAVVSYRYWQNQLGAEPDIVGRQLIVNGHPMTILGVAPEGFESTILGERPLVYVPISMRSVVSPWFSGFENRRSYWVYLFGRLRDGVTQEQAQARLNALYTPILADVEAPLQAGMSDRVMTEFRGKQISVESGIRGQSNVPRQARTPLTLLFAVTGMVLLIACINVASLLLAKAADRSLEMAVRLSLGAGRRQLLTQLLTESVILAVIAGVSGLLVANATLRLITSFLPPEATSSMDFAISPQALLFAAGLSVVTGLVFGLAPAFQASRPELLGLVKSGGGRMSGGRGTARFRGVLATVQIAVAMALLASSALFVRSLANIARVDLGLETDRAVTFSIAPQLSGYDLARSRNFFRRIEEELGSAPGIDMVAAARVPVLAGDNWGTDVSVEGFRRDPETNTNARYNQVGPGYLRLLGMQLLAGREFTEADDAGAPKVAIVNETFAKKFNLGRDAVGKRMSTGRDELDIEIVGLMKDAKYSEVKGDVPPVFFLPYRQDTTIGDINFYVRTANPGAAIRTVRSVMSRLDPTLPLGPLLTLDQQVKDNVFLDRMISVFSSGFALLATLLAAIGLYGVLAYTVAQRTREIGVRMVLGADAGKVRGLVLRQVGRMTVVGGTVGLLAAVAIGRQAESVLFEVKGFDPIALSAAAILLGFVALAAGYIPARRASRVHPMQALRYE